MMLLGSVVPQVPRLFNCNFKLTQRLKATEAEWAPRYINEQMQYINSIVRNSKALNDWSEVKSTMLSKRGDINKKNINAVMLKSFLSANQYDPALSFIDYLKQNEDDIGLGAINSILKFYSLLGKENKLSQDKIDFIRHTNKTLHEKYKTLDAATGEALVHGLAVIGDWQDCLKILEDIKVASCPSHSAYSIVISSLFKCNERQEAMNLIKKSLEDNRPLLDSVYEDWTDYIIRNNGDNVTAIMKDMEEINLHISINFVRLSKNAADKIYDVYVNNMHWSGSRSEVSMSGKCHACKKVLDCIQLSSEEFKLLQSSFKQRVLVGKDVFVKTSPEELDRFVSFIERTAPYDVVLDALNVVYALGICSSSEKLRFLRAVVEQFLEKNKKVLVLGREHMLRWPKRELNFILQNTNHFFTNDLSQDDPFFLTATIFSGPKTDFLSRDKMRGHRFLLRDDKLRSIFLRWQWEHQFCFDIRRRNIPVVTAPLKWTPCAQRGDGWHVPYELYSKTLYTDPMNNPTPVPAHWLCLQPPKRK